MKVLLLGSGGREHAIFNKLIQSPNLSHIDVFPGNGGIAQDNLITNTARTTLGFKDITTKNINRICKYIEKEKYGLVIVGPEQPLVDGIADKLMNICPVFGPKKNAARLEASKDFSKNFMLKYGIPTAKSLSFTNVEKSKTYIKSLKPPIVIKADGLAAGKGVTIALNHSEAERAIVQSMQEKVFQEAGTKILIEEYLEGQEISVFALCDGKKALAFIPSQDHKRAYNNDKGPNTGGMGAYLPVPFINDELMAQIQTQIFDRTLQGMEKDGISYRGLLYAGLMVKDNFAKVIEFNVRFGDPETQALLSLLEDDLLQLLLETSTGQLERSKINFRKETAIVVVLAANGYPGAYKKNILLKNLDNNISDITLLHANTINLEGNIFSTGGRVLNVVANASSLKEARQHAYDYLKEYIKEYPMDTIFYRDDIGAKAL